MLWIKFMSGLQIKFVIVIAIATATATTPHYYHKFYASTFSQEERPPRGQLWVEQCLTLPKFWPF